MLNNIALCATVLALSACAATEGTTSDLTAEMNKIAPVVQSMVPPADAAMSVERVAVGQASWYGTRFQGRPTASGEPFDMNKLTAAHRTLPFGTRIRVVNESNGKSVVVRINDRGPYAGHRIIDLSRKAAQTIGLETQGVGRVKLEVLGQA